MARVLATLAFAWLAPARAEPAPDGWIAYVTSLGRGLDREYQLVAIHPDGSHPIVMAKSKEPLMSPSWAPDLRHLAYVAYIHGQSKVMLHDFSNGQDRVLLSEKGINGSPAWSPDGTRIAVTLSFGSNPDIYVVNVADGRRTRLTTSPGIDTEPTWSSDGTRVAFSSERGGQPQIYSVPADGGPPTLMTHEGRQNLRPQYSPDGTRLAVVNYDRGRYRLGLIDLSTGAFSQVTTSGTAEGPTWSPDAKRIAYVASSASAPGVIHILNLAEGGDTALTLAGDVREPAWSRPLK